VTPDRNHSWDLTPAEGILLQKEIGKMEFPVDSGKPIQTIAGADVSYVQRWNRAFSAIVIFQTTQNEMGKMDLMPVETKTHTMEIQYPYIPGLLAFREGPSLEMAWKSLETVPDMVMFDAAGFAHPRRCGLAVHLGWRWGVPGIGCAKSRLVGEHQDVGSEKGNSVPLLDKKTRIGSVIRTRTGVKPLYVSPGYKTNCTLADEWVLKSISRYRLPEPTRIADKLTKKMVAEYRNGLDNGS